MIKTGNSRSGDPILYVNGRSIHSKYNPVKEADNFIKTQFYSKQINRFILIGPGIGYLKKSLKRMFPNAKLLSLHMDIKILQNTFKIDKDWTYGDKTNLKKLLYDFIPDFLLSTTSLLNWLPCTECFPDRLVEIEKTIQQFFLERKGTLFTIAGFGRKWFSNIYNNYVFNNNIYEIINITSPVFIAASGPSLKESFHFLKKNSNKIILAALPSSLRALKSVSIIPDFVIHTDPGFWAKEHLKYLPDKKIPIIMPLTSAFIPESGNPIILLNQGSEIEKYFLSNNTIKINSHGTVAGSAYLFFRKITNSPIIFLGLDFSFSDIREHVSPHSFDIIYTCKQNRMNGYLNLLYNKRQNHFELSVKNKTTTAFSTYAGWFNTERELVNTFRYKSSNIKTKSLKDINLDDIKKIICKVNKNDIIMKKSDKQDIKDRLKSFHFFLNYILNLLEQYHKNINTLNSMEILELFSKQSLLLEIFQYCSYVDILKLSKIYTTDLYKSKEILNNIYINSKDFIKQFQKRLNYE